MMTNTPDRLHQTTGAIVGKIRTYNDVVEYLDGLKPSEYSEAVITRMQKLDQLLGNVSTKLDTILVAGSNGKSLTMHFAAKLLKEEGFKVGVAHSSHFLTYNERLCFEAQQINNKQFTDVVNEVINTAQTHNIQATAHEIMTMAALLHFVNEKVDIILLEVASGGKWDPTAICHPKIAAITRIAQDQRNINNQDLDTVAFEMLEITKPGTWFISAEQSKIRLQKMRTFTLERGAQWAMPIRKLAFLPYIYEQLYGRIASLGERIAQMYVEDIKGKFSPFLRGNLLATQKGQRGRPTLEAKRYSELNPLRTLKTFWAEHFDLPKGRYELFDKEKPTIVLDNATNLDAYENLFLGVRLLHYQKPLEGFALVLGVEKNIALDEAMKTIRYLFKKVPGQLFFVPIPGHTVQYHEPQELVAKAKELNIKATACSNLAQAFEQAKQVVDERNGLVAIAGAAQIISEYWSNRGIKKF